MIKKSQDLIQYRIYRAQETLEDARILAMNKRWNSCINRLYYACFYATSALLLLEGVSSSKHTGIRNHFNKLYVKTGKIPKEQARIYNDLFERRQENDYMDFVNYQEPQVLPWIPKTETFIQCVSNLIQESI